MNYTFSHISMYHLLWHAGLFANYCPKHQYDILITIIAQKLNMLQWQQEHWFSVTFSPVLFRFVFSGARVCDKTVRTHFHPCQFYYYCFIGIPPCVSLFWTQIWHVCRVGDWVRSDAFHGSSIRFSGNGIYV